MMGKLMVGAATAAYLGTAGLAAADGIYEGSMKDPPVEPVIHAPIWAGLYGGAAIGFGQADVAGVFDSSEGDPGDRVDSEWFDLNGATGSLYLGYNWQTAGGLVLGVEGDWSFMDWSEELLDGDRESDGTDRASYEIDWIASVRGRVGIALGHSLIFATAGVAWQEAEYEACDCDDGKNDEGSVDFSDAGGVFGGGLEHKFAHNFSLRAEGLYYYWGDRQDTTDLTSNSDDGDFAEIRDAYQVRFGLTYHIPVERSWK
jgi:opacity protein-like surface antigen